jgi:hypothetical protein
MYASKTFFAPAEKQQFVFTLFEGPTEIIDDSGKISLNLIGRELCYDFDYKQNRPIFKHYNIESLASAYLRGYNVKIVVAGNIAALTEIFSLIMKDFEGDANRPDIDINEVSNDRSLTLLHWDKDAQDYWEQKVI